ncbi:MAG TPA: lysylphosphatidylglycerol synthase domain-containing protein [Rhizomicrobium sp.]|jgi:putative membrane protein|nr:lysylphosphatidylglycerol synthase domain-containing protein [Rhizomicrobium sp.]
MRIAGLLALAAGLALIAFLVFHSGLAPIASTLSMLGFWGLAIVALAHLPIIGLLGISWWFVGRTVGLANWDRFVWARAVRDAAAEALPFSQLGGYVIGARALTLDGADGASSAASTLLDLILEFSAKLPYLLLGLLCLQWIKPSSPTLLAIGFTVIVIVSFAILGSAMRSRAEGLLRRSFDRFVTRWPRLQASRERAVAAFRMVRHSGPLRASFLLHLCCWFLGAAEAWLIFRLMHLSVPLRSAFVIDSLVGAIRAFAFLVPGAIGVQEGGYVLLCGLFGLPAEVALAFSFIRRARDILIAVPILLSWKYREAAALLAERKPRTLEN